jgi:hypothetical protein
VATDTVLLVTPRDAASPEKTAVVLEFSLRLFPSLSW